MLDYNQIRVDIQLKIECFASNQFEYVAKTIYGFIELYYEETEATNYAVSMSNNHYYEIENNIIACQINIATAGMPFL